MDRFLHIRSRKFPNLPGEEDELVNDGMYGKSLALYLQSRLQDRGYLVPFICCEDWGWWVEFKGPPVAFGVGIYAGPETDGMREFVCTDGATAPRQWSWKRFRFVDMTPWSEKLLADLTAIFQADPDVEFLGVVDDMPW